MDNTLGRYAGRQGLFEGRAVTISLSDDFEMALGARRSVRVSTSHFAAVPYFLHGTDTIITIPRHAAKAIAEISPMQYHECPVTYPSWLILDLYENNTRKDRL